MFATDKVRAFLLITGILLITGGVLADLLGLGRGTGLGHVQFLMVLTGFAAVFLSRRKVTENGSRFGDLSVIFMNTILLLLAVELLAGFTLRYYRTPEVPVEERTGSIDQRLFVNMMYSPFVLYTAAPSVSSGLLSTGPDGFRITPGAESAAESEGIVVYCFGGSTMWGWGQPDNSTIPAYLQQILSGWTDCPVEVVNMGSPGWMSTQELFQLILCLWDGGRPDLVIFYDGGNDLASCSAGYPGENARRDFVESALNYRPIREIRGSNLLRETLSGTGVFSLLYQLNEPGDREDFAQMPRVASDRELEVSPESIAAATFANLIANYRIALALGNRYGFKCMFVWHPLMASSQKLMTGDEVQILNMAREDSLGFRTIQETWEAAPAFFMEQELPNFVDVSGALDSVSFQCFVDGCHLNAEGNRIIAERLGVAIEQLNLLNDVPCPGGDDV